MARPQNTKLKEKILAAAWKSFRERGYDATSYSVIAKMCGIQRNLVQYHFPKKEQFATLLLDSVFDGAHTALGFAPTDLDDEFSNLYALCTCYYQFLLQDGAYGPFLHDIIRDRDLMARTIPVDVKWLLGHLHRRSDSSTLHATNELVAAFGRFYALLYHALDNEHARAFDVIRELEPLMQACMKADSYTDLDIERNTVGMRLDPMRTAVAVHKLNQLFL